MQCAPGTGPIGERRQGGEGEAHVCLISATPQFLGQKKKPCIGRGRWGGRAVIIYLKRPGNEIFDPHFLDSFCHYFTMMHISYILGGVSDLISKNRS